MARSHPFSCAFCAFLYPLILIVGVCGLLCTPQNANLYAQARASGKRAQSYDFRSKRYEVTADIARPRAQELSAYMDAMYEQYERVVPGFAIKNAQPVRLYLFDEYETYIESLAEKGFNALHTGGVFFYTHESAGLAIFLADRSSENVESVLRHEGFHQFAFLRIGRGLPTWANEGMSEYFGEGVFVRGRIRVGMASWTRLVAVQQAIKNETAFGFDEFLRIDGEKWTELVTSGDARAGLMYDQAWSVVHFLMHGDKGKYAPAFQAFLRACANGMQLEQALQSAFGTANFAAFEKAWKKSTLELEPDPLSVAVERMRFLGYGLQWLHSKGVRPESMEELKTQLRRQKFEFAYEMHGSRRMQSASDDAFFEAPAAPKGAKQASLVFVPGVNAQTPATIATQGLAVRVAIEWRKGNDGAPDFQVVVK